MFLLLLIPELVKRTRKRELLFFSNSSRNYNEKLNCKKNHYHYYYYREIERRKLFCPSFPPPRRRNRSIQETGAINVSKSATARERESDQRIPCVGKKGRSASLEFDIGTRQIHAYLEAFALLIKGGPRPRASKRRAAKKRGARGRRRRLSSCALPPSLLLSGNAKDRRVHVCLPFFYERYETKRGAPLLCKFMRAQVSRETATTHIGYWVIGYTSVLVSSCTVNPAREH